MKKLLFVAALGVAGLVSAKNSVEPTGSLKKGQKIQNEKHVSQNVITKKPFPVSFSCGITYEYSVDSGIPLSTVLALVWYYDSIICP